MFCAKKAAKLFHHKKNRWWWDRNILYQYWIFLHTYLTFHCLQNEADLLWNLPATEQFSKSGESATSGILTRIFSSLNNTQGTAIAQKRFIWYLASASDRKSFNASIARMNRWDFDTIIPCHGDVIESNGKSIFEKVFAWHIAAARDHCVLERETEVI